MTNKPISIEPFPMSEEDFTRWLARAEVCVRAPGSTWKYLTRQEATEQETPIRFNSDNSYSPIPKVNHRPAPTPIKDGETEEEIPKIRHSKLALAGYNNKGREILLAIREEVDEAIRLAEDIENDPKLKNNDRLYAESLRCYYNLLWGSIFKRDAQEVLRWSFALGQLTLLLPALYWAQKARAGIVHSNIRTENESKRRRGRIPDEELLRRFEEYRRQHPKLNVAGVYDSLAAEVDQEETEAGSPRRGGLTGTALKKRLDRFRLKRKSGTA